eukprot:sb/3469916/
MYDKINVRMFKIDIDKIGSVVVKLSSPIQYKIGFCTNSTFIDLPVQPPVEVNKIWTITKTETAFIITCNNVEVLNYLFADSSDGDCVVKWGGDVVEYFEFDDGDKASAFYRAVQYKIDRCIGNLTDLPVQPLMEVETIWTIVKTETALIITCNDVEVLNYRFADSSNSKCVKVLGGDVVNVISFIHYDSASNFYRAGKGLKVLHRWCSTPYHSSWFK